MKKIKSFLGGTLTCGIFLVLYGLFPIVFESCLSCTVAEFYAKYCVCAMTMVSLCIIYSIQGLRWIKKNSRDKTDDLSSENNDAT